MPAEVEGWWEDFVQLYKQKEMQQVELIDRILSDENMLAIKGQIDAWREKKESEEAQAAYNARLFARRGNMIDDEEL
ncbi:MAG: hypothetical protein IKH30_00195 [Clostridia bacterium]|nr:hypothetical protein [Clostridia bacterium]